MSGSGLLPLRYDLPTTVLGVSAAVRLVVAVDADGGHLEPKVDAAVSPNVLPDRAARCTATLTAALLESVSFSVERRADGLLGGIGVSPSSDAAYSAPVPPRTAPGAVPVTPAERAAWTETGSLRHAFDKAHPRTAALIADLSSRAEQFLAGLRMSDVPSEVLEFGAALQVVERELAAADRLRREWIAAQGHDVRAGAWTLGIDGLLPLDPGPTAGSSPGSTGSLGGVAGEVPTTLPADVRVPAAQAVAARDYGLLVALLDPDQGAAVGDGPCPLDRVDELVLRLSRTARVAVYRRTPADLASTGAAPQDWQLDPTMTRDLEVVDADSPLDVVSLQAPVFRTRKVQLAFHPDHSIRSLGVAPTGTASSPVPRPRQAGDGEAPAAGLGEAALETALDAAQRQLALLQASDEFTRLAAAHAHGGELASLEQDARFAALRLRRP